MTMAGRYEPAKEGPNEPPSLGKFVRLKLTDEIVEVVTSDSDSITVNFKGQHIILRHTEVYRLSPEEQSIHEQRLNQQRLQS